VIKIDCGPTVYCDIDDTLIMFSVPDDFPEEDLVTIDDGNICMKVAPNKYNIEYLKKLHIRKHLICCWSAAGSDWAEIAVKALKLEDYVHIIISKPAIYIDDLKDPKDFMGKYAYYDIKGKHHGHFSEVMNSTIEEKK
jgi:hypothetical protein